MNAKTYIDLPKEGPPKTATVPLGNLMDIEVTLLNLKGDPVAYRCVQEALELAGFGDDTIEGAIATIQGITGGFGNAPVAQLAISR